MEDTAEILSSLTHFRPLETESTRPAWQSIMQAMQGVAPWKTAYMLFLYGGDIQSRHSFFSGLFMEVMERPETQLWIQQRRAQGGYYRNIEALCLISIMEWGNRSGKPYTHQTRAKLMGVSLSTWKRKYNLMYQTILAIPTEWEAEVMRIVNQRLR